MNLQTPDCSPDETKHPVAKIPRIDRVDLKRIRQALAESDRIDALLGSAASPVDESLSDEEIDRLHLQQNAAWALVRALCLEAAKTDDIDDPLAIDIGDAVITIYSSQDFISGNCREMDASWIAARRIGRPEEIPDRAKATH
jgi:hypothetical protein